jgi:hypothetical protein
MSWLINKLKESYSQLKVVLLAYGTDVDAMNSPT